MYVMSSRELDIQSRLLLEVYSGADPTHTFAYIRLHNVKNPMLIDDLTRTELPGAWSQPRLGSEEEKSLLQSGFLLALCWSSYSEESLMDKLRGVL